jgi:membrane protein implicated in regulation of membrane protease activity
MGYVLRIMATGATTGLFVGVAVSLAPWLGLIAAALVAVAAFRGWHRVSKRWSDPQHRARLAAVVGAV